MPKMKSNSGAKKRFRQTAKGHFKRKSAYKSHILTKKTTKRKRHLRKGHLVHETQEHQVRAMLPYGGTK
jgi:large subunit ribosomal protein L35